MYRMTKFKGLLKNNNLKQFILYFLIALIVSACGGQNEKEAAEFFGRGVYHFKKNELEDAMRFFKESVGKNPELADGYNNIGLIYELWGKYEDAEKSFQEAVSVDPTFDQAKYNHARVLGYLGENDKSLELFLSVEKTYRDSANFYLERGQVFIAKQQVEKGMADFERALAVDKNNSNALTNLGYAQILLNNFESAAGTLKQAIVIDPEQTTAYNNLAFLYGITNMPAEALVNSKTAVKLQPTNPVFRNNFAYSLLINNKLSEARDELESLQNSLSDNSYYLRNLGVYHFMSGNFAEAEKYLLEAESVDPGTFLIYFYLGRNSLAMENKSQALAYFKTGSQLSDPQSITELKKLTDI